MAGRKPNRLGLVRGRVARFTRLDGCGRPLYGDNNQAVSRGTTSVAVTSATTSTDEVLVTNMAGVTLMREASVTSIAGFGVELVFAEMDPEAFSLITNQPVVIDADGNVSGIDIKTDLVLTGAGFALEVWAGAPEGDACDDVASVGNFGYFLMPFLQGGTLGDFSIENGAISFTLTGATTKNGNAWLRGPYDVELNNNVTVGQPKVPGPMVQPIGATTALRLIGVGVAPPLDFIGVRPLLRRTNTPLTSVTAATTSGSRVVNFTVSPIPAAGIGVWYRFGDNEWDYTEAANGIIAHTYAVAGTYTVEASTNGKWVSTTVTVPGI